MIDTASASYGREKTRKAWRLSTITRNKTMARKKTKLLPAIQPGEILREEYMKPLGLSINQLARDLYVPVTRMSEIVNERRSITADTALRLSRYFGNTAAFWMNLQ